MGKKHHKNKESKGKHKLTKKEQKKINHLKLMQGGKDKFDYEKQDWNKENNEDKKKAA